MTTATPAPKRRLSRRSFLKIAGVTALAGAGLYVGFRLGLNYMRQNASSFVPGMPAEPNGWLALTPDERVRLVVAKAEMGQGVLTAFAQIVAEELDVPVARVEVLRPDTTQLPNDTFGTSGSTSVSAMYPVLRRAAAHARAMLLADAAARLGVAVTALGVADGVVTAGGRPTQWTYGNLIGGRRIVETVPDAELPYKPAQEYRIVGQRVPRVDIPEKVDGRARYGYDARLDGMRFGKVLKPPTLGAKLRSLNTGAAEAVPGVLRVVHEGDFAGVVAVTQEAANRGVGALQAEWDQPNAALQQADVDARMAPGGWGGEPVVERGDVERGLRAGAARFEAVYRTPFAAHATLEPQAGLAHVRQENGAWRADVWTATQSPVGLPKKIADTIGLQAEQVVVHNEYLGGGFGRKVVNEAALEAARLSKTAGVPVRVNWSRDEEFQYGFLRPPTQHVLRAALDAQGRVSAWSHDQASGKVLFAFFPQFLQFIFGSDFGATRGMLSAYAFPHHRATAWLRELPVPTASWRGLGLLPNVFAAESFLDELAHAAGADPLRFRLDHLGDDRPGARSRRVLERLAEISNWNAPLPLRGDGLRAGRGLALGIDGETIVAQVAEVAVDAASGKVRVERVYCALDCGLAINPGGIEQQVEGCVLWGVSSALFEEIAVRDGRLSASNFNAYPIATMRDAPDVMTAIVDNPDEGPFGMGEPPIGPVAAAIGNAIFAATGVRLREIPFTPERVQAALSYNGFLTD